MRFSGCVLGLIAALALAGAACGGDAEPTPPDRAGPGDVTDAGAEGAFGEVTECDRLAAEAVAAFERVVAELGDADRAEVDRIDAAMESFGGLGPDLEVRLEGLDCDEEEFQAEVCTALAGIQPGGPAARDLVADLDAGCGAA